MKHDLKSVDPLPDFRLQVELMDGSKGVFDLKPHLNLPGLASLRDPDYFRQVTILAGAATWPNGEDIEPGTLVSALDVSEAPASPRSGDAVAVHASIKC